MVGTRYRPTPTPPSMEELTILEETIKNDTLAFLANYVYICYR